MKKLITDKNVQRIRRFSVIFLLLAIIVSVAVYYDVTLFFADRYSWYVSMGETNLNAGKLQESNQYADKAVYLDQSRPEAHILIGRLDTRYERYGPAEKEFKAALNSSKRYESLYYLGFLRLYQNRLDESAKLFVESMEENLTYSDNYFGMGCLLLKQGKSDDAYDYFAKGLKYADEDRIKAFLHAGLGLVYQENGSYQKAESEFRIARSINYLSVQIVSSIVQ